MQAQRMLSNGCMGFLALAVDKSMEKELDPSNVPVVMEFDEIFANELPG